VPLLAVTAEEEIIINGLKHEFLKHKYNNEIVNKCFSDFTGNRAVLNYKEDKLRLIKLNVVIPGGEMRKKCVILILMKLSELCEYESSTIKCR